MIFNLKKSLVVLILISMLNNNIKAQNNTTAAIAGGVVGLGLGILASKMAINEIEDQQEAIMLEWLIENNEISIPSEFELGTLCWNFNSYTDIYRANALVYYLHQKDSPTYVYLRVIGNEEYITKYGTKYIKGAYLKYDKRAWEKLLFDVLKKIDKNHKTDYLSPDSIYVRTNRSKSNRWLSINNIYNINRDQILYIVYDSLGNPEYLYVDHGNSTLKKDDHHTIFYISSGLLNEEKCIADLSEKEFLLYIPSIQQTVMLKPSDLLTIYRAFTK
jgi:hypothetical protein